MKLLFGALHVFHTLKDVLFKYVKIYEHYPNGYVDT